MEILCRGCRVNDLHIVLRAQRQKPLEARTAVFGTLSFETMREQQHNAAEPIPFVLGTRQKLIDEHLRSVHEIAELRLPTNQTVRAVEAVAVVKPKHPVLGKRAVDDVDRRLLRSEMPQRN